MAGKIPAKLINHLCAKAKSPRKSTWEPATAELVKLCQPLVTACILRAGHTPTDDLKQAGNLGLLNALKSYNAAQGNFLTYAWWSIRYQIQQAWRREHVIPLSRDSVRAGATVKMCEHHDETDLRADQETPADLLIADEERRELFDRIALLSLVGGLDKIDCQVLQLKLLDGLPATQIDIVLRIKDAARRLRKIRRLLGRMVTEKVLIEPTSSSPLC